MHEPQDCKEIKPVTPKGIQRWMFTEATDAEAKSDMKSRLIEKDFKMLEKIEGRRKARGWDKMVIYSITNSVDMNW